MDSITVPAKVFLIGEYSVIDGGAALVASLKPGFKYKRNANALPAHPLSPFGQYQNEHRDAPVIELNEAGLGVGFGSSTAELIAGIAFECGELPETRELWKWYKTKFPKASGADLVGQLESLRTGVPLLQIQETTFRSIPSSRLFTDILIFASRAEVKLKTHEALEEARPSLSLALCDGWVKQLELAFKSDQRSECVAMNEFADYLSALGLETERAKKIRHDFVSLSSVIAAKGCGAGLNDVFLVVTREKLNEHELTQIQKLAHNHELSFVGTLKDHLW